MPAAGRRSHAMSADQEQTGADADEIALARDLRERDPDAVERFLTRFRPVFHHCIGQFEADATLREDLFQELFVAVLERLDRQSFDPSKGSLGTWVYRVAWCRCVDLKRKATTRGHVRPTGSVEEDPIELTDPRADPGDSVSGAEIEGLVHEALADLAEEDRQLLVLRYLQSRTLAEVGQELGITLETAKYRLKRASAHLRGRLVRDPMQLEPSE